mgnify:CR=1 FL=1
MILKLIKTQGGIYMISRYIEYANPEYTEKVAEPASQTLLVFSRLDKIVLFDSQKIDTLGNIFSFLQEKAEENLNEDDISELEEEKEMLYGSLVDCLKKESYFTNTTNHEVEPRNLLVHKLKEMPDEKYLSDETLIAFGYLNSKDIYLTPEDLKILIEDSTWFVEESDMAKDSTKVFINELINLFKQEIEAISSEKAHVNLFVKNL